MNATDPRVQAKTLMLSVPSIIGVFWKKIPFLITKFFDPDTKMDATTNLAMLSWSKNFITDSVFQDVLEAADNYKSFKAKLHPVLVELGSVRNQELWEGFRNFLARAEVKCTELARHAKTDVDYNTHTVMKNIVKEASSTFEGLVGHDAA